MGKSAAGPDMRDCAAYLREIENQQNCSTTILLEAAGSVVGSFWLVHVLSVQRGCIQSDDGWSVSTSLQWPSRRHKTFEGALFCALAEHDAEISRHAFQLILNLA